MNKFQVVKALRNNGDSVITIHGYPDIGFLVTIDFSERYIKRKRSKRYTIQKERILLFSWTDDSFQQVKVADIKTILPLAKILNNTKPEQVKFNG